MIKRFKNLLFGAALMAAAALCTVPAQAQFFGGTYGSQTISAASFTTNYATSNWFGGSLSGVQVNNSRNISWQLEAAGMTNAAAGTTTVALVKSVDGTHYETSPSLFVTLTVPPATSGGGVVVSNFTLDAVGWVAPLWTTNNMTLTNTALRYGLKPGF